MASEKIVFDWPETGRLEIEVERTDSAVFRFEPSDEAIAKMLEPYRVGRRDEEFERLSKESQEHMKCGRLRDLSDTYMQMAAVLDSEGKYADELKVLMLAFYLDLSGVREEPFVRSEMPELARSALLNSKLSKRAMVDMYLEAIRRDSAPSHTMTVLGSLRVFNLCLLGRTEAVDRILSQVSK